MHLYTRFILTITALIVIFVPSVNGQSDSNRADAMISIRGYTMPVLPDSITFCGEAIPFNEMDVRERFEDVLYQQLFREERLLLLLKRKSRYFPFFEKLLKEMDAPDDLKYLAAAESSLRIDAYSNADAAGLWQFIPDTGRRWGLTVNANVDERFHVEKSSRAAVSMLKKLYERFGSWSVAAAAYNNGALNMNAAIKNQDEDNYYALHLNKETRQYLFYIVVLKEIMSRPEQYGFHVPESEQYPPFDEGLREVTIKGPVEDLGKWCKQYGLNYKQIKYHNYWIMKYYLPKGTWTLRVPNGSTISGDTAAASIDTSRIEARSDSDSVAVCIFHTVQSGETLGSIARSYEVRVSEIMQWNQLRSNVAMLDARLKIFTRNTRKIQYTIKPGDTLSKIAVQHQVSVAQIREWNGLQSDAVKVGAVLTLIVWNGKQKE